MGLSATLLDLDTINWFKAQTGEDGESGGTKWMMLIERTLRERAQQEMPDGT